MNLSTIIVAFAVLLIAGGCGREGRIHVDRVFHEFERHESEPLHATFVVSNRGRGDLLVSKIVSSCGCAAVDLPESMRVIRPGHEVILPVRMSRPTIGEYHAKVGILTNDPRRQIVELELVSRATSDVARVVSIDPPLLTISPHANGTARATARIVALERFNRPLITRALCSVEEVRTAVSCVEEKALPDPAFVQRVYELRVDAEGPVPARLGEVRLMGIADSAKSIAGDIPLLVEPMAADNVDPEALFLRVGELPTTRRIRVALPNSAQVRTVRANSDWLVPTAIPEGATDLGWQPFEVEIQRPSDELPAKASLQIVLSTSVTVEMPVVVVAN